MLEIDLLDSTIQLQLVFLGESKLKFSWRKIPCWGGKVHKEMKRTNLFLGSVTLTIAVRFGMGPGLTESAHQKQKQKMK